MKSKIVGVLLSVACGGALAITLTAAAAEAGPLQGAYSPASVSTTEATSATSYAEYRNTEWHFSLDIPSNITAEKTDDRSGTTIQFLEPTGNTLFQVSAWPYQDLDVALGEEGTPGSNSDQGDTLGIVHVFHDDMFEITFVKNGISYNVQAVPENATSTLDILKSWQFI
jgi:hypothetical protein